MVPQLLVNGASGIAVGMSTAIPPHNLQEVVAAMCHLVDDPDADVAALRRHMPAPDFPTGGEILDQSNRELKSMYDTGRGNITLRGKAEIETTKRKSGSVREAIVISEIPYMTNKATLVERIASLVNSRDLEGVSDVRDESDRDGMRVVVELKKGTNSSVVLNNLYKHTKLQVSACVCVTVCDRPCGGRGCRSPSSPCGSLTVARNRVCWNRASASLYGSSAARGCAFAERPFMKLTERFSMNERTTRKRP